MAWEIWQEKASFYPSDDDKHTTYRIGFLCNTTDISFGPVMYFDVGFNFEDAKDEIYRKWDTVDPRQLENNHDAIADEINRIMKEPQLNWRHE